MLFKLLIAFATCTLVLLGCGERIFCNELLVVRPDYRTLQFTICDTCYYDSTQFEFKTTTPSIFAANKPTIEFPSACSVKLTFVYGSTDSANTRNDTLLYGGVPVLIATVKQSEYETDESVSGSCGVDYQKTELLSARGLFPTEQELLVLPDTLITICLP